MADWAHRVPGGAVGEGAAGGAIRSCLAVQLGSFWAADKSQRNDVMALETLGVIIVQSADVEEADLENIQMVAPCWWACEYAA